MNNMAKEKSVHARAWTLQRRCEGHGHSSPARPALHASIALLLLGSPPDRIQRMAHQSGRRIDGLTAIRIIEVCASARASTPP